MIDANDPRVAEAFGEDRAIAADLLAALEGAGRRGHPALDHLKLFERSDLDHGDLATVAAVGFECGVRVHLGAMAGPAVTSGETPECIASLVVERPPMGFDADGGLPYLEIAWRAAVVEARRDFLKGAFDVPREVPGSALISAFSGTDVERRTLIDAILGEPPWDDVLDPVSAMGNFLAQAIPGYQDLDLLFRQAREDRLSAAG